MREQEREDEHKHRVRLRLTRTQHRSGISDCVLKLNKIKYRVHNSSTNQSTYHPQN
jgi:hypothetical protein